MNRKEFILSGAGAFFIASAGKAFGADAPSNRVRLALVGCREKGRGAAVVQRALQVPGVEIAYVCDVDSRAMDYAADLIEKKSNGASRPKKEKDLRKILADKSVDGILSETPDHFHAWSAVMAMRAGKAVYVEKPCCAFCPREGEIILDTWRKTGMVFQQGSQRRSSVPFRIAAELVRKGELIGKPTWGKTWYMTHRAPIGKGQPVAVPEWLDWDLWQGPAPRTTGTGSATGARASAATTRCTSWTWRAGASARTGRAACPRRAASTGCRRTRTGSGPTRRPPRGISRTASSSRGKASAASTRSPT